MINRDMKGEIRISEKRDDDGEIVRSEDDLGHPIHSQVRRIIKQESEKIVGDFVAGQPEIRPSGRDIAVGRQISRSPLGLGGGRPISV